MQHDYRTIPDAVFFVMWGLLSENNEDPLDNKSDVLEIMGASDVEAWDWLETVPAQEYADTIAAVRYEYTNQEDEE